MLQPIDVATSWNERRLMAHNKNMLAQAYLETERLQLALQMAEEARDLYERLGMTRHLADREELLHKLPGNNSDS